MWRQCECFRINKANPNKIVVFKPKKKKKKKTKFIVGEILSRKI